MADGPAAPSSPLPPGDCLPPCPVADGRAGLLCDCGNAARRLRATFDRLDEQREAALRDLFAPPRPGTEP